MNLQLSESAARSLRNQLEELELEMEAALDEGNTDLVDRLDAAAARVRDQLYGPRMTAQGA